MTSFPIAEYNQIMNDTFLELKKLSELKGGEYAGDGDRLANFRRNAEQADTTMEFVWRIYAAKHWDALMQYEKDLRTGKIRTRLESIEGRVDDMLVYLLLFKCMIRERNRPNEGIGAAERVAQYISPQTGVMYSKGE
jgi:hypothetical protein